MRNKAGKYFKYDKDGSAGKIEIFRKHPECGTRDVTDGRDYDSFIFWKWFQENQRIWGNGDYESDLYQPHSHHRKEWLQPAL